LPSSIVVADLSGDGVLDLAVANQLDDNVAVFLGNGNGTFGSPATYEVGQPLSVASADLNGDGALDLAVASYSSGSVAVFLGNGDGGFPESVSYPAGDGSSSVAIGDLNGDGAADLAVRIRSATMSRFSSRMATAISWPL
jgi:hypothetical protein